MSELYPNRDYYRLAKKNSYGGSVSLKDKKYIVIHNTGNNGDTAKNNMDFFATGNTRSAGAQIFIDQSGKVAQSMPINYIAYSVGDKSNGKGTMFGIITNTNSISIELCDIVSKDCSSAMIKATANVIAWIKTQCPNIKGIYRHYDVTTKQCLPVDETEVLTREGWKNLREVTVGEEIVTYNKDTDELEWGEVLDLASPYESEVLYNHGLEATANHRMYISQNAKNRPWREVLWGEVLEKKQKHVKNGAMLKTNGIELTDEELRLLVWIQGDGHYMRRKDGKLYGLEFHLKKERKISRLLLLLEDMNIEYTFSEQTNGTKKIRVYNTEVIDWAEQWLDDKTFSYKLVGMSKEQWNIFKEELLLVDGCYSGVYTSAIKKNLDVVQAISATHNQRTKLTTLGSGYTNSILFSESDYSVGKGCGEIKKRTTMVSCVTVPTSFILVRQYDRTFVVGNCPQRYISATKWKALLAQLEDGHVIEYEADFSKEWIVRLQKHYGTTADGIISGQKKTLAKYFPAVDNDCITWTGKGSELVRAIQKKYNCDVDGLLGEQTIKAWQKQLFGEGSKEIDGIWGKKTSDAIKKWI